MKFFKKTDIIILIAVVVVSVVCWTIYNNISSKKSAKAEIYYNNKLVETVDLNKKINKRFSIPQDKNVIFQLEEDGSIRFEESDCPDKICVKSGKLRTVGETAACIPNKIFIKIVSENNRSSADLDG